MKILVIDDMESFRLLLREILGEILGEILKEHSVVTAPNGEEGLKIFFLQNNFDLVITDRNMPGGMFGEEVIRMIKLSSPGTKTILMSAIGEEEEKEVRRVAKVAGADYFVNKTSLFAEIEPIESIIKNLFSDLP